MHLIVNGVEHEIRSDALTSLLRVLREELFIMSPKAGCEQGDQHDYQSRRCSAAAAQCGERSVGRQGRR